MHIYIRITDLMCAFCLILYGKNTIADAKGRIKVLLMEYEMKYEKELKSVLELFRLNGIETKQGMTEIELAEKERLYGIFFPPELRLLYTNAVPVAKGFYDWTDDSPENIWYIKKMIEYPIERTIHDVEYCRCWMDEWG